MTKIESLESKVENYLDRVRTALHGLPKRQIDDIMRELRAHVIELAEGKGIEAAFASLGDPVDLAKAYQAESQIIQGECSSSTARILLGLRHAGRTRAGRLLTTVLYVSGYVGVVTLWTAAADKLFFPSRTGLWYMPGDWQSIELRTNGSPRQGAHELLGWWFIPAAIIAGWILRYLIDSIARWWLRRHRQSEVGSWDERRPLHPEKSK